MLKIGITGGIGSGKSTACSVFKELGVPIYNSDQRAKEIMVEDRILMESLKDAFGTEIYTNGALNRAKLASIVFSDKEKLSVLNNLVHPAVGRDYQNWLSQNKNKPYTIKEAALLFEAGIYKSLDYLILVTCPEEERIDRVVKRDGVTREEVKKRIANQWPEEDKLALSDFVLNNSGEELLIPQVVDLHAKLLKL